MAKAAPQELPTNSFVCVHCNGSHAISDVFLWSGCRHKYGRGCAVFHVRQMLYAKDLPLCSIGNCKKLLLEDDAELVLPQNVLLDFCHTHEEYLPATTTAIDSDDEKHASAPSEADGYQSMHSLQLQQQQPVPSDDSSDGIICGDDMQAMMMINADAQPARAHSPAVVKHHDDDHDAYDSNQSGDEHVSYYLNEQQPLLGNTMRTSSDMETALKAPRIECTICGDEHDQFDTFAWSGCRHQFGRQCVDNIVVMSLCEQQIPKCPRCHQDLQTTEAQRLLPYRDMQVFKEMVARRQSLQTFKAEQKTQESHDHSSDQMEEKQQQQQQKEHTGKKHMYEDEELEPSVLVLPHHSFHALMPMDDDFVDGKNESGAVLSAAKTNQLKQENLFYCAQCRQLIAMAADDDSKHNDGNGQFVPSQCDHATCKQCARSHILTQMQQQQKIPTCFVCPQTFTDVDLLKLWDAHKTKQFLHELFTATGQTVPALDATQAKAPTMTAGDDEEQNDDDDDKRGAIANNDARHTSTDKNSVPVETAENQLQLETNDVATNNKAEEQKSANNDDDSGVEMGYCLTDSCHKKGKLNIHGNKHETSRLDCTQCGITWCVVCGVVWHLGQTCQQYQEEIELQEINAAIMAAMQTEQQL